MSCRTTAGGSVSTGLARAVSGLDDKEIQHLFHALKREGAEMDSPSELRIAAWRARQYDLIQRMKRMSDSRRDSLRQKLFRSQGEPVPDGATFYAWENIEARARQEVAIRSITTAIDLDPPGSHADQYELGEDGRPTRVWYSSYGSNLHEDRFLTYIKGGQPEGSSRTYDGCTDQNLPEGAIPIRFAGCRPHFALTSRVWGGGIAFIDAQKGETAQGLGRAYNISISQFDEVVAQENGLPTKAASQVPLDEALTTGRSVIGTGSYETILHIGDYQGAPVITFTAPFSTRDATTRRGYIRRNTLDGKPPVRMPVMTNKPSPAYLRMIGAGLHETFGMDEVAQADYLRGCPGGNRWSRQQMVRILRGQDPDPTAPVIEGAPKAEDAAPSGTNGRKGRASSSGRSGTSSGAATTPTFQRPGRPPDQAAARSLASRNPRSPRGRTSSSEPSGGRRNGAPRPVVPPTTVSGERIAGVRRYPTAEDQAVGVEQWTKRLTEARQAAAKAPKGSQERRDREAVVVEYQRRVEAAQRQNPVRMYREGRFTSTSDVRQESARVISTMHDLEDKEAALMRARATKSGKDRDRATRQLAAVRHKISRVEAAQTELDAAMRSLREAQE